MPRRAYSYIRWSGWQQSRGDSRRRQSAEWAPRVARERGWLLDEGAVITDEARSAYDGSNKDLGALAAFLADVKSGHIPRGSVLLVESLDRLSREELDEADALVMGLFRLGISILTREPERFYEASSSRSLGERLEILLILSRGHEESATKSFRLTERWKQKRSAARATLAPRGRRVPGWLELRDGRYHVRPGCADVLRLIFRLAADGVGFRGIAEQLARLGDGAPCWLRKGRWGAMAIRRIVQGREVLGEYQPARKTARRCYEADGNPIVGYYPSVVTEADWLAAQAAKRTRARKTGRPGVAITNLFAGICHHARTRGRVQLVTERPTRGKARYHYLATSRDVRGPDSHGPDVRWPYGVFESAILDALDELTVRDLLPPDAQADAQEARCAELTRQLAALAERVHMLKARVESPESTAQQAADAQDSLDRVRGQQTKLAAERDRLKLTSSAGKGDELVRLQTVAQHWREQQGTSEAASVGERLRGLLRRVVEEVWVLPVRLAPRCLLLHVQLYLTAGGRRYLQVFSSTPPTGFLAPDLGGCDFRAGEVGNGHATREASA